MASVWSAGGNLNQARSFLGGAGTQTAGLCFGGAYNGPSPYTVATTNEYDGTTWSSGGALATKRRRLAGCGTQTAGLSFGGESSGLKGTTEEYDGTAWSAGGALSSARDYLAGCGTQTAGLSFGGHVSDYNITTTEEYNGTAWSSGGALATGRGTLAGCGTQTAGLSFGGNSSTSSYTTTTEEYDGTTWSSGSDLATGRIGPAGGGIKTAGLCIGGYNATGYLLGTEEYNYILVASRHRGNTSSGSVLFNGNQYVGDYNNGKIYQLDMDTYTDDGNAITRTRRAQIINKERNNVIHNKVEVDFEHGVGLDVAEGVSGNDPQATLKWSDDEGNTWSDGVSVDIGAYQQYSTRAIWRRLGKSRNRIYELTIEEPVKVVITGAYADLKACRF